jgi:transcriptional regulator with XRE-family HTH domain
VPTARDSAEGAARAFGAFLRAQRESAQLTLRELADRAQISNPYLSQLERGLHLPSVAVIRSLAEALNLSAELLLTEAAGLQRVAGGSPDQDEWATARVEAAVRADDRLTHSQKRAILTVYHSMLGQHVDQ